MPWLATEGSSLYPVLFAIGFTWLSLALGRRTLIVIGVSRELVSVSELGVVAAGIGAGLLQFVPFALGAGGFMTVRAMQIAIGLLALALIFDLWAVAVAITGTIRRRTRLDSWTVAWLVALSPALLMAALTALAPSLDDDGLAYHLTVPKRWMESGWLYYLPTYPYSNAPMGVEMLFGLGMAFAGDAAAKCIHYALGVMAAVAIYLAGCRASGRMVGAVLVTLFLVGPGSAATLFGYAYVEGAVSLTTAGAVLSWLVWYRTADRGFLRSAALLAGVAVSFKISAALFPVALLAATAVAFADRRGTGDRPDGVVRRLFDACASASMLIPLVALPMLPWLLRAFLVTGNPVFPVLASVIPSRDLPADLARQVDRYNRYMTWGNVIGRDWTLDQRALVLTGVTVILALAGAMAFVKLRGWTARGLVVVLTVTSIIQLQAAGLYIRYWIPIAAPLLLPIVVLLAPVLSRRVVMGGWIALTFAGALLQAKSGYLDGPRFAGLLRTVGGIDQRSEFLRARLPLYPLYEHANRDLPADAGIMLSSYCGAFYIDRRTFCAEFVQTSLRFTTWEEFTEDLRRLRIGYIMAPTVLATGGPTPDLGGSSVSAVTRAAQYQLLRRLLTTNARTLLIASDQGLYEISPSLLAKP